MRPAGEPADQDPAGAVLARALPTRSPALPGWQPGSAPGPGAAPAVLTGVRTAAGWPDPALTELPPPRPERPQRPSARPGGARGRCADKGADGADESMSNCKGETAPLRHGSVTSVLTCLRRPALKPAYTQHTHRCTLGFTNPA